MTRYGTGSLREVRPGVFRLRVFGLDRATGKRRQFSRTVRAKGVRSARDEMRRFHAELPAVAARAPRRFGDVLSDWLANLEREGRVAPSTLDLYRSHATRRIAPALGGLPVAEITGRTLDDFYGTLSDSLAPSTVQTVHAVCMAALRQAQDWTLIDRLPRARPPRGPRAEPEVLTLAQVSSLISAASDLHYDSLALLIRLAVTTGARRGELLGLQVADYDRDGRTLHIERQVTPTHGVQAPKRGKGRPVALSASTCEAIDEWLVMSAGRFRYEHGPWLLSDDGGEHHLMPNRVSEAVARIGSHVGIPVHTHALRHAHSSLGVAAGVDPVTMAHRAGHTPEVAARTYLHPVSEADRRAAEVMGSLLSGGALRGVRD